MNRLFKFSLVFAVAATAFLGCADNDIAEDRQVVYPPDANKESKFVSFSPDSGGVGTQLIIKGQNLGTDTSYLRVTVNDKKAAIIGVRNDYIYAVVPARADTGLVKLYVGKGDNVKEFVSTKEFRYKYKRNVSTLAGQNGNASRDDGEYDVATFRRPWALFHDNDDVIYEMDEAQTRTEPCANCTREWSRRSSNAARVRSSRPPLRRSMWLRTPSTWCISTIPATAPRRWD